MSGPLDGMLVLDFTQVVAGPLAALVLADLGAEVVKIEPPGGDSSRQLGPSAKYGYLGLYETFNRDKKSVVLDLREEADRERALALADRADVLVESSRVGVMDRLGLGADAVRARNPRLVYVSINGYGERGPYATRGGVDMSLQGETGWMSITGEPDGPPTKIGAVPIDVTTGHVAAQGALAALLGRSRHGNGDVVRVSLYDVACHLHAQDFTTYLMTGHVAHRTGNFPAVTAPAGVYETADGSLVLAAYLPHHWAAALEVMGDAELAADPRFATMPDRVRNSAVLIPWLQKIIKSRTTTEWLEGFRRARLTTGEVLDTGQAAESPQFAASDLRLDIIGEGRAASTIRTPARLDSFSREDHTPAPLLDRHRDTVLAARV